MAPERIYNVPLRREWLNAPLYKRAKKAGAALKQYIAKHMKTDQVLVGPKLNMKIWERGIKNPPHHVKVTAIKDDSGVCRVELVGHKFVQKEKIIKAPKASGMAGKLQEKMAAINKDKPKKADKKDTKEETSAKKEKKPDAKPAEKKPEAPKTDEPKPESKPADKPVDKPVDKPKLDSKPEEKPAETKE